MRAPDGQELTADGHVRDEDALERFNEKLGSICAYDISHHEDPVASFHDAYNAGFVLCICKATGGLSYVDPKYAAFMARLKTIEGQMLGSFHFGTGDGTGADQCDHYLSVSGVPVLSLDVEPNEDAAGNPLGPSITRKIAEDFVERFKAVKRRPPLVYGGSLLKEWAQAADWLTSPLMECELWLSEYGPQAILPRGWSKWRLWQFTDGNVGPEPHSVPGVGNCDINRFPGTPDDLRRWYASL